MKRKSARDEELEDNVRLLRAWHQFHAEELELTMNGMHSSLIARLMEILRTLELKSGQILIDFVKARNWNAVDANTKLIVLHEINRAITKLRTRNGFEPINDPLWDERENASRISKAILFPPQAALTGANSGHSRTGQGEGL